MNFIANPKSKTSLSNVIRVDRKLIIGNALERSKDSSTLNTSFVERHNLTIRRGSAYLHLLTPSHARHPEDLKDHLELLRCHYIFIRPHSALKYGNEIWTPVMQAGLTSKRSTFRQVFLAATVFSFFIFILYLRRRQNVKIQIVVACLSNS